MPTPFGPQLIGETEKTLNALLRRLIATRGLTEPQWVSLRLADLLDGLVDSEGLIAAIRDRAHYLDAADLVDQLTQRGLLDSGRLTPLARELTSSLQATINTETASIWNDLPGDDVAAATRLLNEVVARGRVLLA